MTLEAENTAAALPGGRLLSYVAAVNTPTRVKRVASVGVLVVGIINLAAAALLLGAFGWEMHERAAAHAGWLGHPWGAGGAAFVPHLTPEIADYVWGFETTFRNDPELLVLGVASGFCGLMLLVFCRAVKRGQKVPAYICMASTFPLMAVATASSAGFATWFLMYALGLFREPRSWWAVPHLLGFVVCGLIVLLLKDLCGFLKWIAKQPSAEKPAVAFLPVRPVEKRG